MAGHPAHTGVTQAIRDALARSPEPLSVYKIHLATGIKPEKIRSAIGQMVTRTGSIVCIKGDGPRSVTYALYERRPKPARESGNVAGRIVYPGYVYGASRLG